MAFFNTLTIKTRLISASLLLFFLFVSFAGYSVFEIRVVGGLTRALYDHPLQVSNAALKASMGIVKMHRSMKDGVLSQTQRQLTSAIEAVRFEEHLVLDNLDIIRDNILGVKGEQLERDTRRVFLDWKSIRNEVIDLVLNGDRKKAAAITRGKGADHVRFLEQNMSDLVSYARNKAGGFLKNADSTQVGVVRRVILFVCVTILLLIVTEYFLIKGILDNIKSLTITMSEISKTGILTKSHMTGSHEIAVMSRHFNKMVKSLSTLLAVQKSIRELNTIMVDSTTVEDFGEKFIEKIVESTQSAFGAFYLFHPDKKIFEHVFSTGFDMERMKLLDENILNDAFNRAFKTRKIMYAHEISKDTVFTINTIAGKALPRCMVTIPILMKEQVLAIIALGSLADYSEPALKILEQIQFGAGTALSNIMSSEKTISLARELTGKNIELEVQARELQVITDDLKQQNIELDVQSKQLEEANRLKSEFLSNMSHELRTPLNSVMALSSVLQMNTAQKLDKEEVEYLEVINRNGKHLLDLINDILDLSKIEAGHMDVTLSFFSLKTITEELIDSLQPLATEKELSLGMEIASDLPEIQSDEKRVHQILLNLLGNAVKFTEEGEVAVLVSSKNDRICFKVSDTGIGISEKDLPFIFDEFRQVDGSTSRQYEGTGLGLAIAYKATINLGGDLTVESKLGRGTTFTLTLPVKWQGKSPQTEILYSIQPFKMIENPENIQSNYSKKRVLVVEDNDDAIIQIKMILEQEGYQVDIAKGGKQAQTFVQHTIPDGIILDLMMPDIDGFDVLEKIRGTKRTAQIPVLVLTAKDLTPDDFQRLSANNIQQLVQKGDVVREGLLLKVKIMLGEKSKIIGDNISNEKRTKKLKIENRSEISKPKTRGLDDAFSTILIIENNPDNMITMKAVLKDRYAIIEAANGEEGLKRALHELPDLIFLDISLPGMDGYAVVKEIKANEKASGIPVVALTAHAMKGDRDKTIFAGCDDYLSKPIDPDKVLKMIEKWQEKLKK